MCTEYIIDNKIISTQGELFEKIKHKIPFIDNTTMFEQNSCLCGVDAYAVSKILGIPAAYGGMYYHFGTDAIEQAIEENGKEWVFEVK